MEEFDIDTAMRQAGFISQLCHESGEFRYKQELGAKSYFDKYTDREDLGNTDPVAIRVATENNDSVGNFYKGRGPIQITGYYNYLKVGGALKLDLVNHPDLLLQPTHGCRAAGWYWRSRNINNAADVGDVKAMTKAINGGYNGLTERMEYYARALGVLK